MSTTPDPTEGALPDRTPYLPASPVTAIGAAESVPPVGVIDAVLSLPTLPVAASDTDSRTPGNGPGLADSPGSPSLPMPVPIASAPTEPPKFDAKEMVESQKRINANPAYGALPTATEASREAATELRAKAQRVRQRNKRIGWFVGLAFLGGVAAAGWYGYQAYQDEQAQAAIERTENAESDERGQVDAASPLGQQVEVIDARAVVGEADGEPAEPAADTPAAAIAVDDLLPPIVFEAGQRFPDATGRETYMISADEFAAGDPAAFGKFVRLLSTQPQIGPTAPAFDTLPAVNADEIVISVDRDGDELRRAIVWGADSQRLSE